ncbi:MAG TPA: S9 family peptidase [Longimicrobium sp.]|jgi:dipeptidyl aminopeptidase/acylaminoacyl peptidase
MSFVDMYTMRTAANPSVSPDRKWMAYQYTTPNWLTARGFSDIYVASLERGVSSTRRVTFTDDQQEARPRWTPDGQWIVYASNPGGSSQLYITRPDSTAPRQITASPTSVGVFEFSPDGQWLVYRTGRSAIGQQLHALPVADIVAGRAVVAQQLTQHPTGIGEWEFSPDSKRIYFTTTALPVADERARREKGFTAEIRHTLAPASHLLAFDVASRTTVRLDSGASRSVVDFTLSKNGRWIGYRTLPNDRYRRTGDLDQLLHMDLHLLETATGRVERLTNNQDAQESPVSFSPNGDWLAYTASDDTTRFTVTNSRVYLRRTAAAAGSKRKLGTAFDGDVRTGFWSEDGRKIYFSTGHGATTQLFALGIEDGRVRQLSHVKGTVGATPIEGSSKVMVQYSDPLTPPTMYVVSSIERLGNRATWLQLTNTNPQLATTALGETEEITWTSRDGTRVGGVLVKPVGYQPGRLYPLIVMLHGGPHSAEVMQFNGDDNDAPQVYAGVGYVVFAPNYRGSSNYGERFKAGLVGDYFGKSFADVMSGVDFLIQQGLVDSTKMGVLGHSAGGSLTHWIVTQTNRFKAASAGAGVSNWFSMYAGSDYKRPRLAWFNGRLPWEDPAMYWAQSPVRYANVVKTPTFLYGTQDDPRVPIGQQIEMYTALQSLGVATELFIYPGDQHGTPGVRNRLANSMAQLMWMDFYVRGIGRKFSWRDVLRTLDAPATAAVTR